MSGPVQKNRGLGRALTGAAVLLIVSGGTVTGFAVAGQAPPPAPPQPPAAEMTAAPPAPAAAPEPAVSGPSTSAPTPARPDTGPLLSASKPTRVAISRIGINTPLMELGLNPDGTPEVSPLDRDAPAGWYRGSPTPGEQGPAVILGHVNTVKAGPVVFYRLGETRPGDTVTVSRADGSTATFTVDRVASLPKDGFPDLEVYGNTTRAEIRLITCGGVFDPVKRRYPNVIVVFGHLV